MFEPSNEAPAISVIIPACNEERFLGDAIASICAQSFDDFELIVVNNGSTDATGQIISEWKSRDARVRGVSLERASLHQSLRRGVAISRANFIARIDADDMATAERLQRQYETMVSYPALGVLGTAAHIVSDSGRSMGFTKPRLTDQEIKRFLPEGCPFVHSSVMMRREVYLRAGGYRPGLNLAEDYDLWLRMALITEMANLPEPLVKYRLHKDSINGRRGVRLAVSSLCVAAAAVARQSGLPEPFANGTPLLRQALPLLGLRRRDVRLRIYRQAFERRYHAFPVPLFVKARFRRAAVACGLKPVFRFLLKALAATQKTRLSLGGVKRFL